MAGMSPDNNNDNWNVGHCADKVLGFQVSSLDVRSRLVICWLWGYRQLPNRITQCSVWGSGSQPWLLISIPRYSLQPQISDWCWVEPWDPHVLKAPQVAVTVTRVWRTTSREIMRKDSQAIPLHQIPALPGISYGSVSLFVKMVTPPLLWCLTDNPFIYFIGLLWGFNLTKGTQQRLNFIYYMIYIHTCVFVVRIKFYILYHIHTHVYICCIMYIKCLALSPCRNAHQILGKLTLMTMVVGKLTVTGCLLSRISSSPHCMAAFASEIKP